MSNNSSENRRARLQYREYYLSQSKEMQSQLPVPEREEDISGMDGNWVFEVKAELKDERDYTGSGKEDTGEPPSTRTYTEDEVQEVVRRVVMAMQLTESPEALFQARCILIAFGIGEPPTESELARTKGCSRQFVSKKVKRIQQLFRLSPSQYMRSDRACKAYSRAYYKYKTNPTHSDPPTGVKESIIHPVIPLGNRHRPRARRSVVGSKTTNKANE
jgi:hypothetical protein